jgi:hypothetical protein
MEVYVYVHRWNIWPEARQEWNQSPKPNENMGPYAGADYNLTLCPLHIRLQHIYHGQPYARVDFNPQSETLDLASG